MRYMLVNVSDGALQIDIHDPNKSQIKVKLHRLGPEVAINLGKGKSVDILPYFNGSLEKAHIAVKHSKDVLRILRPDRLQIYVCDDQGNKIDVDKVLKVETSKKPIDVTYQVPPRGDTTKPALEVSEVLAAQDQFEAKKRGEANEPKTYKKYKKEELSGMNKKELMKIASKIGILVDKNSTKEDMVNTILGA